ncbi:hypothetical protein L917_19545 [Phytophthora nicotianae]|uniref:Uncharacterized protein n=3 Tax=Phytophthora nicotianae TaxID=4792 RepID=W2QTT5_PHYN3|nr:hypothetical protein PPTG_21734 [Phytophthora nicotianae INRA-310]ETL26677.1 hypothetical protein L916_19690 [Phytophthora nicotianae]ETO61642.1 hypothetical protein F444_20375 [Phytophthora nicotianae P1976]ETL79903.1 hypothetical protein L917_19546 [Phytophthora nicotianae]ETL79908.1 hypothetical protein L917_19545 [Phytophthora nicotianae]ETM33146.1 hypothetical protein L914_19584 [Phytophthora nicotianae]
MATSTTVSKSDSQTLETGMARRHALRVVRRVRSDPDWCLLVRTSERFKVDMSTSIATMRYDYAHESIVYRGSL